MQLRFIPMTITTRRFLSLLSGLALLSSTACKKDTTLPTETSTESAAVTQSATSTAIALTSDSALPEETDATIVTNTLGSARQYADWPTSAAARKNVLFVMIPGTTGTPGSYREIQQTAAAAGYYSFAVAYSNLSPIEFQAGFATTDKTVENILEEYLTGTNASPLVVVNRAASLENRIIKMILLMNQRHPNDNWKQFLTSTNTLRWDLISVCGHSQGSDHAVYMSKKRALYRASFIGGPGRFPLANNQTPSFLQNTGLTPAANLYGFNHTQDNIRPWSEVQVVWGILGIPGTPQSVDNLTTYTSHRLSTSAANPLNNGHLATVIDGAVPLDAAGLPIYAPVWRYLNLP